jgi:hypothetical protein
MAQERWFRKRFLRGALMEALKPVEGFEILGVVVDAGRWWRG